MRLLTVGLEVQVLYHSLRKCELLFGIKTKKKLTKNQAMNRFVYYEKKVASKLLLSKFVYLTTREQIRLRKITTAVLPPEKDSEIAAFNLAAVYGRLPTFASSFHHTEKSKILRRVSLTATSKKALPDLQLLVNKVIPFQFENKKYYPDFSTNKEIN